MSFKKRSTEILANAQRNLCKARVAGELEFATSKAWESVCLCCQMRVFLFRVGNDKGLNPVAGKDNPKGTAKGWVLWHKAINRQSYQPNGW
jgi:hypothetical protein